ncbi:hypothetical protein [Acidisphaera sp. L21]|uniref:hypothetical protein n=1 Tax=Acidisphaera sp. L21 TaxID=1641851 RepID=UPI00131AEFD9|nr:hypothetical protein [Acidisphaera sp. L21]
MVDRRADEVAGSLQQRFSHFPLWGQAIMLRAVGLRLIAIAADCDSASVTCEPGLSDQD